jgi:putative addiction module killer protein
MNQITINFYVTKAGKSPFADWHDGLDVKTRAIIRTRLDRVRLGNLGDCKPIKGADGIWELRINYEPGFRIYFGKCGAKLIRPLLQPILV